MTKKSAVALYKASKVAEAPAAIVAEAKLASLTDADVKLGLEALVRELGKDKARLFLEAAVNGRLRGESLVERIVRRNPVAAVLTAGVVGATLGALFGPAQLPAPEDDDPQ